MDAKYIKKLFFHESILTSDIYKIYRVTQLQCREKLTIFGYFFQYCSFKKVKYTLDMFYSSFSWQFHQSQIAVT